MSRSHPETNPPVDDSTKRRTLDIQPRYYRWFVSPEVEWTEANTGHATLDWQVPLDQAGLVLVDVWDRHFLRETATRTEQIIRHRLAPTVNTLRGQGLQIIHAPAQTLAKREPLWVGHRPTKAEPACAAWSSSSSGSSAVSDASCEPGQSDWPPPAFIRRTEPYQSYAPPIEPRSQEQSQLRQNRAIHPAVRPQPPDVVIATGEELHQFCRRRGLLFLFYAGFNTNACIVQRNYGIMAMQQRGYTTILLRDCTTAMEAAHTQATLGQTQAVILMLEMFHHHTLDSQALIAGLPPE